MNPVAKKVSSVPRHTDINNILARRILKALSTGALHGLGVSCRIEQMTGGTFSVQPGSLFPALHRLEEAGWLASLAALREQPAREVLRADPGRKEAARRRNRALEVRRRPRER